MKILVDADACPVIGIIKRVAGEMKLDVILIADTSHILAQDGCETLIVDKARDSVDLALINRTARGDIVVTQDYGVATMALGKGAAALNQNGMVYSSDNIDRLLFERFLHQKVRRAGGRTGGHRKRSREDDEQFEKSFRKLCRG